VTQHQTLEETIHALRGGTITATQLVQECLEKIFQKEGELHGFITVTKEEALNNFGFDWSTFCKYLGFEKFFIL
jgi:Asp-tRNA(Asn)/Glu-tRNA(Gln) amidotransferase A subunit family amidase